MNYNRDYYDSNTFVNKKPNRSNDVQNIVTGTIKESKSGGEVITFSLNLPILSIKLDFVVTVPSENTGTAPVYIHTKLFKPRKTRRVRGPQQDENYNDEDAVNDNIGNTFYEEGVE